MLRIWHAHIASAKSCEFCKRNCGEHANSLSNQPCFGQKHHDINQIYLALLWFNFIVLAMHLIFTNTTSSKHKKEVQWREKMA